MNRVVVLCPGHGVRWQGIGHTDPLPAKDHKPHRSRGSVTFLLLETQNNHPMQSTASSTNICSSFHRQGQRPQCRAGVCCTSGQRLCRCFLPGFIPPLTAASSPDRLFLPCPSFPPLTGFRRRWVPFRSMQILRSQAGAGFIERDRHRSLTRTIPSRCGRS